MFVETIANPRTQVADLARIGEVCARHGTRLRRRQHDDVAVAVPADRRSARASIVNALTKYIGGHGNALGGSVTDTGLYDWTRYPNILDTYKGADAKLWAITQIRKKGLRDWGGTLAAEQAHHLAAGAETLALRMDRQCANALALARYLEAHPKVRAVHYPGLAVARRARARADAVPRATARCCRSSSPTASTRSTRSTGFAVVVLSSNLGDNRTLAIPVAQTIFWEMGRERREAMGIAESLDPRLGRHRGRGRPDRGLRAGAAADAALRGRAPAAARRPRRSRARSRGRASRPARGARAPAVDVDDVRGRPVRVAVHDARHAGVAERLRDGLGVDVHDRLVLAERARRLLRRSHAANARRTGQGSDRSLRWRAGSRIHAR